MAKILLTGITGFLGSNIASVLVGQGHLIVATYRSTSSKELCAGFEDKVQWVLQDSEDEWMEEVIAAAPSVIIHSAWLGVGHQQRDHWDTQAQNISYLQKLLQIAAAAKTKKFIGLGSQAEYGQFNGCINEDHPLNPMEAYGRVKILCAELLKQFCNQHQMDWYWLRLFSFFGRGEADHWLIPSMVKKMIIGTGMDFTAGEQKYAYLYVKDLGIAINNIIATEGCSGTYNISGKNLIALKTLIEGIRDKINSSFQLNFGKLPYRANQSMHIQGDSAKFTATFGEFDVSDFDSSMLKTLEYFKKKFNDHINEGI